MIDVCFFKQKTAYEMRVSYWSSDVCSSDLTDDHAGFRLETVEFGADAFDIGRAIGRWDEQAVEPGLHHRCEVVEGQAGIERVDADEEGPVTRGLVVEQGGDLRTRGLFHARRDTILEIEDQAIGRESCRERGWQYE